MTTVHPSMPQPTRFIDPAALTRISTLELVARTVVEGFISGLHRSPHLGFSVNFAEYRPYRPGDDIRKIDWKVFRAAGPLLRQGVRGRDQHEHLARARLQPVDGVPGTGDPEARVRPVPGGLARLLRVQAARQRRVRLLRRAGPGVRPGAREHRAPQHGSAHHRAHPARREDELRRAAGERGGTVAGAAASSWSFRTCTTSRRT